jgi:hypothetical protein
MYVEEGDCEGDPFRRFRRFNGWALNSRRLSASAAELFAVLKTPKTAYPRLSARQSTNQGAGDGNQRLLCGNLSGSPTAGALRRFTIAPLE